MGTMNADYSPTKPIPQMNMAPPQQSGRRKRSSAPVWIFAIILAVLLGFGIARLTSGAPVETVSAPDPILNVSESCGVDSTYTIPEVEGVSYTESTDGTQVTITAQAIEGYELSRDSETRWSFDLAGEPCPEDQDGLVPPTQEQIDQWIENGGQVAGEWAQGTKDWFKEYGPGIWQRVKDGGVFLREWIEDWAKGAEVQ